MGEQVFSHRPVLLDECIQALRIRPDGIYLDGTLGRAGHSAEIARRLAGGHLICIDRDLTALEEAREKLAPYLDRVRLVHGNFSQLETLLGEGELLSRQVNSQVEGDTLLVTLSAECREQIGRFVAIPVETPKE